MSDTLPEWLPELIDTNGSWDEILGRLYAVFEKDIKNGKPCLNGRQVWWDRRCKGGDSHEEGFWHLVTREDKKTKERLLDTPRAKRLQWCRAVIANSDAVEVTAFDYIEGDGTRRTYLWGKSFDYVVILESTPTRNFGDVYRLVTAYVLDGPDTKRSMQRKFDDRVQEMQSPP
jgi:hypothetical protein